MVERVLLLTVSILTLSALLVACGGDSGPGTAPPIFTPSVGSGAPSPTPASVLASTMAGPFPTPTSVPEPVAVAPAAGPTRTPTPTARWTLPTPSGPTATPTAEERTATEEEAALGLLNGLGESVRGMTAAFDVNMELVVLQNGEETIVPIGFEGDFHGGIFFGGVPLYSRGRMKVGFAAGEETMEVISVPGRVYARDESGGEWEEIPASVDRTVFPDPRIFVFDSHQSTSHLTGIAVIGEEMANGVNSVVISASSQDIEIFGAPGEFDIIYRFGKRDGRLVGVEVLGELMLRADSFLGRYIEAESTELSLHVRFFDYGKSVEILTPELVFGTISHHALLLDDGRILITGGFKGVANNNTIIPLPVSYAQIFDFETGLWKPVGGNLIGPIDMETRPMRPALFNSAVKLPDGRLLVFGVDETGEDTSSASVYLLDAEKDAWEFFADGGLPRFDTNMVVLQDGKVLIAGGVDFSEERSSSYFQDDSTKVEIFDPSTKTWHAATAMPNVEMGQAMLPLMDGRVLAIHRDFRGGDRQSAHLYDPVTDIWTLTDTWILTGAMPRTGGFPVAQVLKDGMVLLNPAYPDSSEDSAMSHLFDRDSETWESDDAPDFWITFPMNRQRAYYTLTLLPDGRVMASGGDDFFEGNAAKVHRGTTEIFDPETGEWTSGPDLEELRSNHTATLLPDGRILLTGGIGLVVEKDEIAPTFTTEFVQP